MVLMVIMLHRFLLAATLVLFCGGGNASIFSTARYFRLDKVIYYILRSESVQEAAVAVGSMKIRTISIS